MAIYPVLFSFRRCPYAIRARMAIAYAKISCELREVVLRSKPEEMLAISSKGTVPVLQLPDGQVLDESMDVMYWALQQADPDNWLQADEELTAGLIEKNDFEFKGQLDRYKYFQDYPEYSQEHYRERGTEFLAELEQLLAKTEGRGLLSNRLTLTDIAIFPFVRQFARVDLDWFSQSSYYLLKEWFFQIEQSDLFLSVMNKYPAWQKGDSLTLFG